jgi:hypothetical protein
VTLFPTVIRPTSRVALAVVALAVLGGCTNNGCNEFAPPADRVPTSCPAAPKPAVQAKPKSYCYQTLGAESDCYAEPQPGRSGLIGTYPTPQN